MSDNNTTTGGADSVQGGAQTANSGADNAESPAKRAYDGILSELKAERAKRRELEEKVQVAEAEKLLEQGKLKEYADTLKAQLEQTRAEAKQLKQSFAFTTVQSQIERKAQELGCVDSELLIKAINLDNVQVDEKFNVDTQSLTEVIETVRKTKPYLFKSEGPRIKDGVPSGNVGTKPDLAKMTTAELKAFAKSLGV